MYVCERQTARVRKKKRAQATNKINKTAEFSVEANQFDKIKSNEE
jgi:hypothetical protein